MDKVSILMSTYKEPIEWIKCAVDSILGQTYKNLEFVIVVDNPNYQELVQTLQDYSDKNDFIKILVNDHNLGLVKSLNKGLKHCTGKYIARMDADDISLPDRIEKQLSFMKKYRYDLVGCNYEVFYGEGVLRVTNCVRTDQYCKKVLQYESCVSHPTWLVRKAVYDQLGGYRDFDACEDLEFLQRASLAGFYMGNCSEVLLRYRDNPNSISHQKNIWQRAITCMLTESYRKRQVASNEAYEAYLSSNQYRQVCKKEEFIVEHEKRYKDASLNKAERFGELIKLMTIDIYRRKKIVRRKINWWKRKENEMEIH